MAIKGIYLCSFGARLPGFIRSYFIQNKQNLYSINECCLVIRFAQYAEFKLGSEKDKYRLEIGGYEGNAGDSLNDPWYGSNLRPFSTFDRLP